MDAVPYLAVGAYLLLNWLNLADLLVWWAASEPPSPRVSWVHAGGRAVVLVAGLVLPVGIAWSLLRPLIAPTPPRPTIPTGRRARSRF